MRTQPAVIVTVAIVTVTTLVSGPVVSAVDLTDSGTLDGTDLGEGRLTVGDVTVPETVVIERGDFGAGTYYLRVPPATAELQSIAGRPIISYEVSVRELGFTRSGVHVLSAENEGTFEMTLEDAPFGKNEIRNESYVGELSITARYDGQEHVLERTNVTIEVIE